MSLKDFQVSPDVQKKEEKPSLLWLLRAAGKYGRDSEGQLTQRRGQMRRPGRDDALTESIESNLLDGHTEKEYFCSAHGARAGLVDKGLVTAHSGYLLRDWIYRLQDLYIVEEDCRTSQGLEADKVHEKQILGSRFDVKNVKGDLIEEVRDALQFRSPWSCQARDGGGHPGICQRCYGYDPATGRLPDIGLPVGILAAQALGERITQETLKSFHTGGVVEEEKKGLQLVSYLREAFSSRVKRGSTASRKLYDIFKQFPSPGRPGLVHFEVILSGYKAKKDGHSFLSSLADSQAPKKLFEAAIKEDTDDLYGVVSRIVSGRLIDTGPMGGVNG